MPSDHESHSSMNSCNYANLTHYNAPRNCPQGGCNLSGASGSYIVPNFGQAGYPPSYGTLIGKVPSCSGYRSIDNAYGSDCGIFHPKACGARPTPPPSLGFQNPNSMSGYDN